MSDYLRISVTFLDRRFHGRGDGGEPEWPPSPLRLMQAIIAANADAIGTDGALDRALVWLESQKPPIIVAPRSELANPYCLSVPNNAMDIVGKAWSRGNLFGGGDANPATHRTMKMIHPVRMIEDDTIHYLWSLKSLSKGAIDSIQPLIVSAKRMVALGWGFDLVAGYADRISGEQLRALAGERWFSATTTNINALRTPIPGTLVALRSRYDAFLNRISETGFAPVEPLTRFKTTGYRRPADPITRPCAVFEIRLNDDTFCRYPKRKLIHITGMVRHLAIEAMRQSPPTDAPEDWVERYVAGHRDENAEDHRQFSYLPLPSIQPPDDRVGAIRRVMIAAPIGDDAWLEHLAQRLNGRQLKPKHGNEFDNDGPPTLVRVYRDKVAFRYTKPANRWASVTPVILPGHDDRKRAKTKKLIKKALAASGVEQPCNFEWSAFSQFRNSYSAHKYDKFGQVQGFYRPKHLSTQTAVHLTIQFDDDVKVPGPLAIGAGRHCGFGLMAENATIDRFP
jgi:CRISPR-associated protein Csb2